MIHKFIYILLIYYLVMHSRYLLPLSGWVMYGLFTSGIVATLFPMHYLGVAIVFSLFLVLAAADCMTDMFFRRKRMSLHF